MNEKATSLVTPHSSLDTPHSSLLTTNRLLITGGCGFIGLNLIKFLIHKGYQNLRILDNLCIGTKGNLESLLSELGPFTKKETKNQTNYSLDSSLLTPNSSLDHVDSSLLTPNSSLDHVDSSPLTPNSSLEHVDSSLLTPNSSLDHVDSSLLTPNSSLEHVDSSLLTPNSSLILIVGDIRDRDTCIKATQGIDAVIHLAAHAGVIPSIQDPFFDFETNTLGTLNMLYASVQNKIDRFIFASSNAPIGNQDPPLSEGKVAKPLSPYGASKLSCEGYCSAFYGSYGLKTVVLRFSNVYGPYSLHKNSVIAKFINDGISKGELTVYGDGTQTRDFIHVDDLSHAISLLLTSNLSLTSPNSSLFTSNSVWGETFHLGTGIETSIMDLAKLVKELFDDEIKISFAPERKGEIKRNYSDITKANKILGFSPHISVKDGVREAYEWFRTRNVEDVKNGQIHSGSE